MKLTRFFIGLSVLTTSLQAQDLQKEQQLDSVVISSTRIDLPFEENSRTITVISSTDIKNSAATNVADVLQQFAGVDIRRRGTAGSQADLYIRGGGFDQTLLLIDGIKMDDAQTGHHTMNAALPLEVIERIEIIKGPAARVFGQNAFTGAINIVTKNSLKNTVSAKLEAGSFGQFNAGVTVGADLETSSHIVHIDKMTSEGYRYNTDYDNSNYFVKSVFNKKKKAIEMIATFQERKFGANGFYARESAIDQYEETQNSLLAFSTQFKTENLTIKPRVYWKRNQDEYIYIRNNPTVYRNLHITDKIGTEVNASYTSNLGVTGFGVDVSKVYIRSNNLGNRQRFMSTLFLEHQFKLFNNVVDVTPGVAVTYFSDFKFYAFPGLDLGVKVTNNLKAYGNIGYTYRIPTYTDLFYNDPSTEGNENLEPEKAFAQEIGLKYNSSKFSASAAIYNRDSENLIDYIKPTVDAPKFIASNIAKVNTKGFEVEANYNFNINNYKQTFAVAYNFLEDNIIDQNKELSRYSLNTLKHHFTSRLSTQLFKNITQNIVYKHAERTTGQSYNVWDASLEARLKQFTLTATASNIFNAEYIEAGFVPMPPSNVLFGLRYNFN
ncbi:Outer membrane vitamin B12 receptor BtuB [Mesoflavibacter sp. HG96]|uniref:TonB-dependent receptor plug domain-containing protein n=1 Tax=unclassified Mesoflavibacter TaxID=2630131 RepID=UPI000D10F7E4|nr:MULTISPECIES: TonB-dependent receptor [unclassified Mesoflavibacter]QIJ89072.1 Outer membrane vitamin B12 receptor BtuB [Mesoflavibacter sp. HG96]QIJ91800.1 Outer membrane vitamin B12 receptor BtuB [Mesoflavibacter sp. HG37]